MHILGVGGFSHDSAACIIKDGKIVAAGMEERFTRRKHEGGVPHKAIEFCLKSAGITREELDHVAFYMNPRKRLFNRIPYRLKTMLKSPRYGLAYLLYEIYHNANYVFGFKGKFKTKDPSKQPKLHFLDHHTSHCASSFFVSPFEEAALLSIDYIGEWASTIMGVGKGNKVNKISAINYPQSLGTVYSGLTDYLGFLRASDEYKVMGLASYGEPKTYVDKFRDIIKLTDDGRYKIDLSYFQYHYMPGSSLGYMSKKFIEYFGPPRKKDDPIVDRHKDIAAALQKRLEEVAAHLCRHLYEISGKPKNLCLAGGVALNSVMNGRLLEDTPFTNIYVQPAAGDDGIAIGASYYVYNHLLNMPRNFVMERADFGPEFSDEQIEKILKIAKIPYTKVDDPAVAAAKLIADGEIVGWFQGRMEFGPRALGHRSILADPTREDMKDILNLYVKHREDFRPFAPSVCEESFNEYFIRGGESKLKSADSDQIYPPPSPFMLFVFDVKEDKKSKIPAVTHVDGTARVQTVNKDESPLYYKLIKEFEKIKGVPVVLNTSYNIKGEPIVCAPQDAIRCFFGTGMDQLVIGNFVIDKKKSK